MCTYNNLLTNDKHALYVEGQNGWSNDYCKPLKKGPYSLGSARHYNFECFDFMTKKQYDEYKKKKIPLDWSYKTCNDSIYGKIWKKQFKKLIPNGDRVTMDSKYDIGLVK